MPRSEPKKSRNGSETEQWSEWVWDVSYYYRTRPNSDGTYIYDYFYPEATPDPLPDVQPHQSSSVSSNEWKASPEARGRSQTFDPEDHIEQPGPPSVSPTRPRHPSPPPSPPPKKPPKKPPPKPRTPPPPPKPRTPPPNNSEYALADTYSGNYSGRENSYAGGAYQNEQQWPSASSTYSTNSIAPAQMNTTTSSPLQQSRSEPKSQVLELLIEGLEVKALASTDNNATFISPSFAKKLGLDTMTASGSGRTFEISTRKRKITERVRKRVMANIELLDHNDNRKGKPIRDWLYILPKLAKDVRLNEDVYLGREHMTELQQGESKATLSASPKQQHGALPLRNSSGPAARVFSPAVTSYQSQYGGSTAYPRAYSSDSRQNEPSSRSNDSCNPEDESFDSAQALQNHPSPSTYYSPPAASSPYESGPPALPNNMSTDTHYTFKPASTLYPTSYSRDSAEPSTTLQNTNQLTYSHDPGIVYKDSWRQS